MQAPGSRRRVLDTTVCYGMSRRNAKGLIANRTVMTPATFAQAAWPSDKMFAIMLAGWS